jgi:hypothetical protein
MLINPLTPGEQLIDAFGRPTHLFIQKWNALRALLTLQEERIAALEALGGETGTFDTETDYLEITLEDGRVTMVNTTPIPP